MNLEACLPDDLRGPDTKLSPFGRGQSGASVFRVDTKRGAFVLKVAPEGDAGWGARLEILRRASELGLAPKLVHVDAERRAVVSVLVEDRFLQRLHDPASRAAGISELGEALRRVHELPLPPGAEAPDARVNLRQIWAALEPKPLPAFARAAIQRMITEEPPPADRAPVLSHNDVNPGNLVHDGERLMLVDWDAAGPNDPRYDFAAAALFLRFDDAESKRVLGEDAIPARFGYFRRFVAALCGAMFLHLSGRASADDDGLPLQDFYAKLRTGALQISAPEGRWQFGLALLREV